MKNEESFRGRYEVEDGYVGKSRPQNFEVLECEIEDYMDESDIEELYEESLQEDFTHKVYPCGENLEEFKTWAKEVQEKIRKENSND